MSGMSGWYKIPLQVNPRSLNTSTTHPMLLRSIGPKHQNKSMLNHKNSFVMSHMYPRIVGLLFSTVSVPSTSSSRLQHPQLLSSHPLKLVSDCPGRKIRYPEVLTSSLLLSHLRGDLLLLALHLRPRHGISLLLQKSKVVSMKYFGFRAQVDWTYHVGHLLLIGLTRLISLVSSGHYE